MAPLFHRPRRRPSKPAARWPQLHDPLQVALINEPPELPPSKLHNKDLSLLPLLVSPLSLCCNLCLSLGRRLLTFASLE